MTRNSTIAGRVLFPVALAMGLFGVGCGEDDTSRQANQPVKHQAEGQATLDGTTIPGRPFTFVRIQYSSGPRGRGPRRGNTWQTDYPASDRNFSARFQETTGIQTDPNGTVLQLTDPQLGEYPFIYIAEGGGVLLSEEEISSLQKYLLGGGFLMTDDCWGEDEWHSLRAEIKRVFPDRAPVELGLDHPIFSAFYQVREKPQVPTIGIALRNQGTDVTWEREDAKEAHYFGLEDDEGRLMAVFCQNTDLADGWEREGENEYYDREFVFKKAYPMGINIVFYALRR